MSHHRPQPVPFTGTLEGSMRRDEAAPRSQRLEMLVAKRLELAARYGRLWRTTGHDKFKHIATREANAAERMMKGI